MPSSPCRSSLWRSILKRKKQLIAMPMCVGKHRGRLSVPGFPCCIITSPWAQLEVGSARLADRTNRPNLRPTC